MLIIKLYSKELFKRYGRYIRDINNINYNLNLIFREIVKENFIFIFILRKLFLVILNIRFIFVLDVILLKKYFFVCVLMLIK